MNAHSKQISPSGITAEDWANLVKRYRALLARPAEQRDYKAEAAMAEVIPFAYGIEDTALREQVLTAFACQLPESAQPERGRQLVRPPNPKREQLPAKAGSFRLRQDVAQSAVEADQLTASTPL